MSNSKDSKGAAPQGDASSEVPTIIGGVPVVVVRKGAKAHVLRLVKGPGAPKDFKLDLPEIVIGRSLDAQVVIDSTSVSRKHASLRLEEDHYVVSDLDSANGIFVNAERAQRATLADGDSLQVGDAVFVYQRGG
jgi:pSer/pThr/pTyr-binding forkhead associated (FHA) protein